MKAERKVGESEVKFAEISLGIAVWIGSRQICFSRGIHMEAGLSKP
ncbi:hypothetical protein HMPREF9069_00948 [Atopobium sp. oral taxon 810 str. F0209]|nr:hypothetical protein HMPREF9069_00948 [Atopobium sp. oral taxon 810 str. F0209]